MIRDTLNGSKIQTVDPPIHQLFHEALTIAHFPAISEHVEQQRLRRPW
jgi:hypothetical protein